MNSRNLPFRRATADYWYKEHNVRLGVQWHESDKTYVWCEGPDGVRPVDVSRDDIEGQGKAPDEK